MSQNDLYANLVLAAQDESASVVAGYKNRVVKTLNEIEAEQKKAAGRAAAAAEKDAERLASKGALGRLKDQFGEESQIGLLVKSLRGAGAIAGITAGVAAIDQITKGLSKAIDLERQGKGATVEYEDALVSMIPIAGSLAISLDEAFTGRRRMAEAGKAVTAYAAQLEKLRLQAIATAKQLDFSGFALQKEQLNQQFEDRKEEIYNEARKASKGASRSNRQYIFDLADETVGELQKQRAKQLIEIDRQAANERAAVARTHIRDLVSIERDGRVSLLQASGQTARARLLSIHAQFEAERNATKEAAQQQLDAEKDPKRRRKIVDDRNEKLTALIERETQEQSQARKASGETELQESQQHRDRIDELQAQARQTSLRQAGRGYQATLDALLEANNKELDAVERGLQAKLRAYSQDPVATGKLAALAKKRAAEEIDAINAKTAAEKKAATEQEQYRLADRGSDLKGRSQQIEIDGLRQIASLGDQQAARDAERLQIAEEYRQKREQVLKTLEREKDLTADQQADLRRSANRLTAQQALAIFLSQNRPGSPLATTSLIDGGNTTGIGRATTERAAASQAKELMDVLKKIQETLKSVEAIPNVLVTLESLTKKLGLATPVP